MLTEKEKRWLEFRKNVCFRCKKRRQTCSLQLRDDCLKVGYPIRDLAMMSQPDYADAAEFEARCNEKMARKPIKSKPCAYGKCPRDYKSCPFFEMEGDLSLPFCRLLCVHIAVEQEMEL